jgi:hypothetical protein
MRIRPEEIGRIEIYGLALRVYSKRNTLMFDETYKDAATLTKAFRIVNEAWEKELGGVQ